MKSFLQIVVPILILMAVVGFVAYLTQYTDSKPAAPIPEKPSETTVGEPITFDDAATFDPASEKPMEVEHRSHNHRDFWFHTTQEHDVSVALQSKSCTCTDVQIGSFKISREEWSKLLDAPSLTGLAKLVQSVSFTQVYDVSKQPHVTITGTPPDQTPLPYLMRMNWDAKEAPGDLESRRTLNVRLVAQVGNGPPSMYDRESRYIVVPPVGMAPYNLDFGEIVPNGRRSATIYVWSFTRERLTPQPQLLVPASSPIVEPCGEFSPVVELSRSELDQLPKQLGGEFEKMRPPECGYRFTVTLHERLGENQLELGPLTRRILVSFRTGDEERRIEDMRAILTALVRGDVNVLNGDANGHVNIGIYKYDRPRKVIVRLGSENPSLELEVESTSDPKIKAVLRPSKTVDGRKEWEMDVEIEPNFFLGEFPPNTLVILKSKGVNSRRLRIPLSGRTDR